MSLIRDVQEEIRKLDLSGKSLRKFGIVVGLVFLFLTVWIYIKGYPHIFLYGAGLIGGLLVSGGIIMPYALKGVYRYWMGMAFCMGWVVSRILLIILFYLIITPIGLLTRLMGKKFMEVNIDRDKATYWVRKDKEKKTDYQKMY